MSYTDKARQEIPVGADEPWVETTRTKTVMSRLDPFSFLLLATDQAIWNYAVANAQTIITKDEDFKNLLLLASTQKTPVVWVQIGNCSNAGLNAWFQPLFPQMLTHLEHGEYLIELF